MDPPSMVGRSFTAIETVEPFPDLPRHRALILDLDGLLLDTEPIYWAAWRAGARELGCSEPPDELLSRMVGKSGEVVVQILKQHYGPDFHVQRFFEAGRKKWLEILERRGVRPKPGYRELMAAVRERALPFAVATNSQRRFALKSLEAAGILEEIPLLVSRDQVGRGKPAPDIYLKAAEALGLEPGLCLAVEDSEPGLTAAYRAGCSPVLIPDCGALSSQADRMAVARFDSLAELAEALVRWPCTGTT